MKVIGYIRVSTTGQAEDGFGLAVQEQAIRSWAKAEGHRLVSVTRDEAVSGTVEADDRPGLVEALQAVAEGQAEGLVVMRLDRLARTLTIQEAALARVWKSGGRVFSVETGEVLPDDPDDPMRAFVRQVFGAVAELDRAMIVKRLRAGRRAKADAGGYAHGAPRYGTRAKDRALVAEPSEALAVARAVALRRDGCSLRGIAEALTAEGFKPKRSARWHPQVVARILARESVAA